MARRNRRQALHNRPGYQARGERLDSRLMLSGITAIVSNTSDSVDRGSLRAAIIEVDTQGDPNSPNTILFQIPTTDPGFNPANGTFTIMPQGDLPAISRPVIIDGTSESTSIGQPALIVLNGSSLKVTNGLNLAQGSDGSTIDGLEITSVVGFGIVIHSSDNTIGGAAAGAGNILVSDTVAGVLISPGGGDAPSLANDNLLLGNFIGTNAAGASLGDGTGITLTSSGNTIGGITAGSANVIGFNTSNGIQLNGAGASGNVVLGNEIGTNAAGANLGNAIGVNVGSPGNTVGGATTGSANVIGWNSTAGVEITGAQGTGNVVLGNFIGTNAAGANLANPIGVLVGSSGNTIGGVTTNAGNVIGFNANAGIQIAGPTASANVLMGNFIGTDRSGQLALGNDIGVLISDGTGNSIGGTTTGAGNVISGNFTAGVELSGGSVSGTQIQGNKIGTDASGTRPVTRANLSDPLAALQNAGVVIIGSLANTVGGTTPQAGNLISGNYVGVMLAGTTVSGTPNDVSGNLIGTDVSGGKALGNIVGIYINGAAGNQIGSTAPGSANTVSGNTSVGVEIYGAGSTANVLEGNLIGLAADGQTALQSRNGQFVQPTGVFIENASGNLIGGSSAGDGNVISGNQMVGVYILSRGGISSGNVVNGNFVGRSSGGGPGPGNNGYGVLILDSPGNVVTRTGSAANHFGRNSFGGYRSLSGPAAKTSATSAKAHDVHHAALHPAGPARHQSRKSARGK